MRRKSAPAWRITIASDTGESTTLKLYRSPFPQQFVLNERSCSATSVADAIRQLIGPRITTIKVETLVAKTLASTPPQRSRGQHLRV